MRDDGGNIMSLREDLSDKKASGLRSHQPLFEKFSEALLTLNPITVPFVNRKGGLASYDNNIIVTKAQEVHIMNL